MARHGHLNRSAINAVATEPTTECRDYPHSASSTTKLQRRQYGMMTQRCCQRLNRLGTTLPSLDQLQKINSCRFIGQRMSSPEILTSSTVGDSTVTFAIRHSSTRYSSSTHCHRRYNSFDATSAALRSVEPPSVPGRPLFDRLAQIISSRCSPHHDNHQFNDCQWFINPTLDSTPATRHRHHHRHRTASARLAQRRASMRRTHQRPASPHCLQTINESIDKYFFKRIISFDFD